MTNLFGNNSTRIPEDRSVVVVSDLHLGGKEDPDTVQRFCNFLDYINTGFVSVPVECRKGNGTSTESSGKTKKLLPPDKIILLGDILEVWDSRNIDRNSAFLDALPPFLKMRDMDCDVIYVTGNHDEDVSEIVTSVADILHPIDKKPGKTCSCFWKSNYPLIFEPDESNEMVVEGVDIPWNGDPKAPKLEIRPRHYAPQGADVKMRGIEAGGTHYAFIHGQQFDKLQITYTISKVLKQRFDPVDFFQDLACTSASRHVNNWAVGINVVFTIAMALILGLFPDKLLFSLIGFYFGLGCAFAFIILTGIFARDVMKSKKPKAQADNNLLKVPAGQLSSNIVALIFVAPVLLAIFFVLLHQFFWLFIIAFFVSLVITLIIALPRFVAYIKRKVYNALSSKNKSPEDLIRKKLFNPQKYSYGAEVLVFGHTHIPDFGIHKEEIPLLVNTGTWVRDGKNIGTDQCDTFVYIDKDGICCMRWVDDKKDNDNDNGNGKVECLCLKKDGSGAQPLCDYIQKKGLKLKD